VILTFPLIETIANVALVSLLILFYVFLQITEYIHSSRLHSCNGIKLIKIQPRCRVPVNNLIYFISLLYAYLLLIHIYVMYYNYIVLSWCTPMYGLLSINYLHLNFTWQTTNYVGISLTHTFTYEYYSHTDVASSKA